MQLRPQQDDALPVGDLADSAVLAERLCPLKLGLFNLDVSRHQPRKLTRAILDEAGLAVAMGTEHRQKLAETFDHRAALFSEIAYGVEEPLLDVFEVVPDWRTNEAAATEYGRWVIDYIIDGMAGFMDRMPEIIRS